MEQPLKPLQEPAKPTAGQIVTGFLLTLFALPFLFVATCLPAVLLDSFIGSGIAILVWVIGLIAFGIWRAGMTENPGVRWAIILIIVGVLVASVFGLRLLFPESPTG